MKRKIFLQFILISGIFLFVLVTQVLAVECEANLACPTDYPHERTATVADRKVCLNDFGNTDVGVITKAPSNSEIKGCLAGDIASPEYDVGGTNVHNEEPKCCPSGYKPIFKCRTSVLGSGICSDPDVICCSASFTQMFCGDVDVSTETYADSGHFRLRLGTPSVDKCSAQPDYAASCFNEDPHGDWKSYAGVNGHRDLAKADYSPVNINGTYAKLPENTNYFCGQTSDGKKNCLTDAQGHPITRDESLTFAPDQRDICAQRCQAHNSGTAVTDPGASPVNDEDDTQVYCFDGAWKTFDEWKKLTIIPQGCQNIIESYVTITPPPGVQKEFTNCAKCYFGDAYDDTGVTPTPRPGFVYSSLGCIDVSRDGLITRFFQIGIGLIGGIMIVRFIQAALKMQTDNPEEIREAREIVTSAIIALFVLVASVAILRFLGINVLNVLPQNFLQ